MTLNEFRTKVYEILDRGLLEVNGKIYYSDDAVIKVMEWIYENIDTIAEEDELSRKVRETIDRAFNKIRGA